MPKIRCSIKQYMGDFPPFLTDMQWINIYLGKIQLMTKRIQKNEVAKRIASRLSIDEKVSEEYLDKEETSHRRDLQVASSSEQIIQTIASYINLPPEELLKVPSEYRNKTSH